MKSYIKKREVIFPFKKYENFRKIFCIFLLFIFFFSLSSGEEIYSQIEGRINNLSSSFFIFNEDSCFVENNDSFDFESPPIPNSHVSFYSVVGNKNLSIDCWNPKNSFLRNLSLVYKIVPPENETGNLYFYWDPSSFFISSIPQSRLNVFLFDILTGQKINLSAQSSVFFSNSQIERNFILETKYEWCGDNIVNLNENCDGQNLSGKTCISLGFRGGNLGCNLNTCRFNLTECYNEQGEKIKDDGSILSGGGGSGPTTNNLCNDECILGKRKCVLNDSFMVCGNFDNDSCSEWGREEKCLGVSSLCKEGFCYECLTDRDCKEGFCINGKCENNCGKSCKELGLECGRYFFCGKLLDCGNCSSGFCKKGVCSNIPEDGYKMKEAICDPNYICSPWSDCNVEFDFENMILGKDWFKGKKERICFDKNRCYSTVKEKEDCIIKREIFIKKVSICGSEYIEVYDKKTNALLARLRDSRYSTKSLIEVFLLPKNLIFCEEERESYNLSLFERVMLSLDFRKIFNIIK